MKRWVLWAATAATAAAVPVFALQQQDKSFDSRLTALAQDKLNWKKDHAAALQEAKKDGKYVIVHFSGPD